MTTTSRKTFLQAMGTAIAGTATVNSPIFAQSKTAERPNIIVIMADDMGYSDLGCYGSEINTPHLDKLATKGMRFTQFYNCAKCNPSRASLLTGAYDQAIGVNMMQHGVTMGELMGPAGYRTICTGKWHQKPIPTSRGFDRYYGLTDGCCNFWNPGIEAQPGKKAPGRKIKRPRRWAIEDKQILEGYTPKDPNYYTTDAFTTYAIDCINEYKDETKPFMMYLAYTAPHYPLHAWPEDIAKYRGKYKVGWDVIRERRYKKMVELGIFDKKYKPAPRDPEVPSWDSLSAEDQDKQDLLMAVYAAMVDRMDQNIGRLVKTLEETGQRDNTLIIFLSDNGGCAEEINPDSDIPPGPVEGYRTLGKPWANATNTPYRKYKAIDTEGGACTPMIANWPKVIKPNSISHEIGHLIDILPTMAELGKATYPTSIGDRKVKPMNGKSLVSTFRGEKRKGHDAIFFQYGKTRAVREGDWKLLKYGPDDWELYNLADDRTELNNVAAKHQDIVKRLEQLWLNWRQSCKTLP